MNDQLKLERDKRVRSEIEAHGEILHRPELTGTSVWARYVITLPTQVWAGSGEVARGIGRDMEEAVQQILGQVLVPAQPQVR